MTLTQRRFGALPDGTPVELYLLSAPPFEIEAITWGAIITAVRVPDRHGRIENVVLGYDTLDAYLGDRAYLGAAIGRYANRIAQGTVPLAGKQYQLTRNDGPHHLHGGHAGFNARFWSARASSSADAAAVEFSRTCPDGEEGYPGTLRAMVRYELHKGGVLTLEYEATCDAPTIVNLTQHTYFNLSPAVPDILGHELTIAADRFTPVDAQLIPTGALADVEGTPFDFRIATPIGARIDVPDAQLQYGDGYDHNFVLRTPASTPAATVYAPRTGRMLEIRTTEPGMQFYSGNRLSGNTPGRRSGLCLETQHFPDSPHHPAFPSTELIPGRRYHSTTTWRFGVL